VDAIRTDKLTKRFGETRAVNELTFSVAAGEIFGLVGPDGAGKTTTMRMLASIMDPSSGKAWVAGRDVATEAEHVKEEIGYMSQFFGLYPDLPVMENIDFYSGIYRIPAARKAARKRWVIEMGGLAEHRGSRYFSLRAGARNYSDIDRAIDSREALVALVIPARFAARIATGRQAPVQMIVDGSDSTTATIVIGYAEAVTQGFSREVVLSRVKRAGGPALSAPLEVRPRVWFNEDMSSRNYIVPGLIAVMMMVIAALLTSLTVAREWQRGGAALVFAMAAVFLAGALSMGIFISIVTKNQLVANLKFKKKLS
jgi:ABC-type nitrate/sulfonate/bicarbonate transport system ATPase subunit